MRATARRWWVLVLTIAVSGVLVTAAVPAVGDDAIGANGYVVVELNSPGAAKYTGGIKGIAGTHSQNGRFDPDSKAFEAYKKHLENEHANFRAALGRKAPEAKIVREYFITANAIAIELNGADPKDLGRLNGAKRVFDSGLYRPTMNESVALIGLPEVLVQNEDAGSGITIGIIDSGIDSEHPFFDCDVDGGDKVDLGGVYTSGVASPPPFPSIGEMIVFDHGTHVAGTAAGCVTQITGDPFESGSTVTISGVAPGAQLIDYNVFPGFGAGYVAYGGSAFSHDIAAALEDAVLDGVDIVNMSLGGRVQGPHDFLAEASNGTVAADVVVVTSAGNEGPLPYTVGSPGSASDVIAVAATGNGQRQTIRVVAGTGDDVLDTEAFGGDFPSFDGVERSLVDWPSDDPGVACTSDLEAGALAGKVVLIARGGCTFTQKVTNATAAGAVGVIVYTSATSDPVPMGGEGVIPAVMVTHADGQALEAMTDSGAIPVTVSPPVIVQDAGLADLLASFSSRGPAPFTGALKPDIAAPGVNILSSVFQSGWELFDGTSMASPHVAGAAALVLADRDRSPAQVKSALTTTATSLSDNVWEVGAGKLNIEAALAAEVFFEPTNASFGIFDGKKPVSGSVVIDVTGTCNVLNWESDDGFFSAAINSDGDLVVTLGGGREIGTDVLNSGIIPVVCGDQTYSIPYLAVVDRKG